MKTVVLLRHGESVWNKENRFTGWTDVGLTEKGVEEAKQAGELLRAAGYVFDLAHTSVLKRAIKTLWLALEQLDLMWIPVTHSWRLNERHYGALQGLNKAETAAKFGDEQVLAWRRSYDVPLPALAQNDPRCPGSDPRYRGLTASQVPFTECLKDTVARVLPYWNQAIAPDIRAGKRVLITAHGNSLRALVKYLDKVNDQDIVGLNIPTGVPLVYELDDALKPIRHYYLGDQAEVEKAMQAVANQGEGEDLNPLRRRPAMRVIRCGGLRPVSARCGDLRPVSARCAAGFFLALSLLAATPAHCADRAELDALHSRIETLKKNLAGAEENRSEASDGLRASERGVSEANRVLHNIGLQQHSVRADLVRVGEQTRAMEAGIAAQQGQLGRLLAMRYASGQQDYLKLLLSGRDPNQTARDLHYYSYISRAQADFIRTLRNNLAGLAQLGRDARDKSAELAELEAKQREGRKELLAQQAERRKVLARLATQIRTQHREIKSLQRDEARLSRLVEELAKVIAPGASGRRNEKLPESGRDPGVFAALKGRLRLPTRGELINRFGTPRSDSGLSWKGLFIRSASGQEVRAVATGRVVFAEWMRGFGNLMIIDHGQSYLTIYGNNEALLKQVGDSVKAGDAVATVGNSGGNPDSGLYFEIGHQGKAFDPMRWVSLK